MPSLKYTQRLAAAAHAGHQVGKALQRIQRVARVVAALGRVGIVDALAGVAQAARPRLLLDALEHRRPQLAAHELVDGVDEQPRVAGELLRAVGAAAGVDDGGDVVGAHVALDELLGRRLHARRAQRRACACRRGRSGRRGRCSRRALVCTSGSIGLVCEQRPHRALDRQIDQREHRDLLRLAVLEHLEIALRRARRRTGPAHRRRGHRLRRS